MNLKKHLLTAALLVASTATSFAGPYYYGRYPVPPPPVRVGFAFGVAPGPGYVWVGHRWVYGVRPRPYFAPYRRPYGYYHPGYRY